MGDRKLNIAFMGTPDFAVPSLKKLASSEHGVRLVVSAPDRPAGRGQKLKASAVKEAALELGLPVLQPEQLSEPSFLAELKDAAINLIVVVAFRKLPDALWQLPEYGTFNLHGSILPDYRGAAPLNWAIINGETETGVTTFFIDEKIDTGGIIDVRRIPIGAEDNVGDIHDQLMEIGADLVLSTVHQIASGQVMVQLQDDLLQGREPKKAPKIFKPTCQINWELPASQLHNLIRGLSPYPAAHTALVMIQEEREPLLLKVFKSRIVKHASASELEPGSIRVSGEQLFVGTGEGELELLEIQLQGKKKIKTPDFLRGFSLSNYVFK